MLADTANLIVNLSLKGNFARELGKTQRALGTFDARLDKTESRAFRAGQQIGTGIRRGATLAAGGLLFLAGNVAVGLESLIKLEGMTAQTEAVLKSTGAAAGVTATEVRKLAEEFEAINATVGDELIQNAENLLLTFTNIRKKAFRPALQAALDMNQALGGGPEGLAGVTKLLGKALQDPEKGLSRLGRAVGGFSDETVKAVKAALKNNDTLAAQNIILAELERRYGGSFARAGLTTAAKVAKFHDAIEDLQRTLASGLLPVVSNVADALSKLLSDPKVQADVEAFGKSLGGLFTKENIATGAKALGDFFNAAREAAPGIIASAKVAGAIVSTAVKLFQSLPPDIQKLAIGALAVNKLTGGLVTNLAGGLISAVLKQLVSGVVNVQGGVVNVVGAPGVGPGVGGAAGAAGGMGGLTKVAVGATIIGGLALSAESIQALVDANTAAAAQGLTPAETAAVRYYQSSTADQAFMAKRLGYVPTKTDFDSGMTKLRMGVDGSTTAVENMKALMGTKLEGIKATSIEAGLKAKNAGDTAAAASRGTTRAIDRKDLSVTVPVNVRNQTVINGRVYNAAVGKDITYINGLPYGGTPQGGR